MGVPVIVEAARTPIGKAYRGALNDTDGHALGAHAILETQITNCRL